MYDPHIRYRAKINPTPRALSLDNHQGNIDDEKRQYPITSLRDLVVSCGLGRVNYATTSRLIFSYSGLSLQQTRPYLDVDNCSYQLALKVAFPSCASLLNQQWTILSCGSCDDISAVEHWMANANDSTTCLNKVEILELRGICRNSRGSKKTDTYKPFIQTLLTRCISLKKLVWDLDEFAMRDEYKVAIEHHGILEELAIIADGPGTSVNFDYSRSSLPTCRKLSLCCYQGPTSWELHSISWNHFGNEGTDHLLDAQPQMFLYGSQYMLGMEVVIYNGQYSTASERACKYQQTGRDRQDLAFQFHWIIRIAESLWMRDSRFAAKQWVPPLSFIPCMPDPLLVQKSIPLWLFVADVLVHDCPHSKASEKFLVISKRAEAFKFLRAYIIASLSERQITQDEDYCDQIRVVLHGMLHTQFSDKSSATPIFITSTEIDYPLSSEKNLCCHNECVQGRKSRECYSNSHWVLEMTVSDHIRQIAYNLVIDRDICQCTARLYANFVRTDYPTKRDLNQQARQRSTVN